MRQLRLQPTPLAVTALAAACLAPLACTLDEDLPTPYQMRSSCPDPAVQFLELRQRSKLSDLIRAMPALQHALTLTPDSLGETPKPGEADECLELISARRCSAYPLCLEGTKITVSVEGGVVQDAWLNSADFPERWECTGRVRRRAYICEDY